MTKTVQMMTSAGALTLELDDEKAPATVANFLAYVKAGHYDGTVFHRVIPRFMIQGGGFKPGMEQKSTNAPVANESANGLQNKRYTLAMARTSDPHSATAQFFINTADNGFLDRAQAQDGWGYAVFGRVVAGTEVIDTIEKVRTGRRGGHGDVPLDDVLIESAAEVA
jgi:peptidyl-prolyl cis-trans isomerase B (cyclophilin B)